MALSRFKDLVNYILKRSLALNKIINKFRIASENLKVMHI